MSTHDPELDRMRAGISCATILETQSSPWLLDKHGSTPNCRKYRRGAGEVLIVNHGGHGWWDPHSDAKGDVFSLIQHLEPNLNFGQVRKALRPLIGIAPNDRPAEYAAAPRSTSSVWERWRRAARLRVNAPAWRYLTRTRSLPRTVLVAAAAADCLRAGSYGNAWFAHRDDDGHICHVEIRGSTYKGSLCGGRKSLFRFRVGSGRMLRFVLAEAPIDALSVAAIEGLRSDTLYAATGGGMGPVTAQAIETEFTLLAAGGVLFSATDDDRAGDRLAAQHRALAEQHSVEFQRLRPTIAGGDWNAVLQQLQDDRGAGARTELAQMEARP